MHNNQSSNYTYSNLTIMRDVVEAMSATTDDRKIITCSASTVDLHSVPDSNLQLPLGEVPTASLPL